MDHIGLRIRQRREELNITQLDLAHKLGYRDKSSIAKIESGAADIVQSKVIAFAKALDTSVAYLMGWTPASSEDKELTDLIARLDNSDRENLKKYITNMLLSQDKYKKESATIA